MEKMDIYNRINDTAKVYQKNATVHELISAQARISPENSAVTDYGREMTYEELDKWSDYVANILLESGVEAGQPIAVLLDRSIELIVSAVAILKCGAVYVPIDTSYPELRVRYILEDTSCKAVILPLTGHTLPEGINMDDTIILYIDQVMDSFQYSSTSGRKHTRTFDLVNRRPVKEEDLAYLLYTSGTTGKPKGVMVTHKAVLNTLFWMSEKFEIGSGDIIAHKTSISFTDSIWEIFWPLMDGAEISIIKDWDIKDQKRLYYRLKENEVSITQFVPSILKVFLDFIEGHMIQNPLPELKWIFNGGEHITPQLAERWNKLFRTAKIANIYGMTESAIYATCNIIEKQLDQGQDSISIGKPIANTKVYILNKENELCDISQKGEICINGTGLAKGYWNKPELTKDKFDCNAIENQTLYRTGDIGALCSDGNIAYFGRMDNQVKIRGNRVEISEVEKNILLFEGVDEVAVIHKKDHLGENILVCFLTDQEVDIPQIKTFLSKSLPGYMIPQQFVLIDKLPLTVNNKVNREKLRSYKINQHSTRTNDSSDVLVNKINSIWKQLLNLESINPDEDFFDMGGNSIIIAMMQISLEKIGIALEQDAIYANNTINKLVDYIRKNNLYERVDSSKKTD